MKALWSLTIGLLNPGAHRARTAPMEPAYRFGGGIERRSLIFLVLFVMPPMPVRFHFLALNASTLGRLCRGRQRSQAQTKHAGKRQYRSLHGIGSIHPFVTCQRVQALLYGWALWRDSYRYGSPRKVDCLAAGAPCATWSPQKIGPRRK